MSTAARAVAVPFTAAIFVGAFLLFLVQPMFGKMVLPLLGGSPGVWNACMLFFQVALLLGYLYADLGSRWMDVRRQWMLHIALAVAVLLALPITVARVPAATDSPVIWLLGTMAVTVGPPFVVLAATGPLIQRWFSRSTHEHAADPYPLYAASNLGSLIALLAYPVLVEPSFRVADQAGLWTAGFVLLIGLMGLCGIPVWKGSVGSGAIVASERARPGVAAPDLRERLLWVALAFVPSSLLLGVTAYITTDLAPAPLFWVLPLALYLLSFSLTFARRTLVPIATMVALQPAIIVAVLIVLFRASSLGRPALAIPLHLAALFVTGMVCHGQLAFRRPAARHLTEFYLWISVGGALGGVFNVLVAPMVFSRLWEYPLVLVAACLLRPWTGPILPAGRGRFAMPLRSAGLALLLVMVTDARAATLSQPVFVAVAVLAIYATRITFRHAPFWLATCLATTVVIRAGAEIRSQHAILVQRSFYGQFRVTQTSGYTALYHGSTLHGAQSDEPGREREPLTYYVTGGPFADLMDLVRETAAPVRVAVIGLGTGTTAAYARVGDDWVYYELDPDIVQVARDRRYFSYLEDSPAAKRVVLGDARLSLEREEGAQYDLIVLDAFSSDAIPIHLLTREAMELYLRRLAPGGRIAIHISNRYIDLEPVIAGAASVYGLRALMSTGPGDADRDAFRSSATWVIVARMPGDLGILPVLDRWRPLRERAGFAPWTDDFSSLWSVLRW